ncbi:MAG: hypothetical protein DHS20C08_08400 [Rhodomicrobium sp.]|nr:MAG: hypothetical protein DHS20C08_08400 [Rhodomicrobium sp.]
MASIDPRFDRMTDPIDVIEKLAAIHNWPCERHTDELTLNVEGSWTDYHISLNWRDDIEALHLACAFEMKVPEARINEIYRLIALVNEQLWLGHFDIWPQDGLMLFRHGLMLNKAEISVEQCEALIASGLEASENYYQAFQYVVWAGKQAPDALASAMFHTEGRA